MDYEMLVDHVDKVILYTWDNSTAWHLRESK